ALRLWSPAARQELAEAVNAHVYHETGRVSAMDAHYVGKLERGSRRRPGPDYRNALRAVLGAATDAELGFDNTRQRSTRHAEPPVVRPAFVHDGAAMQLIITPGTAVVVVPADHPVLLALVAKD